MDPFVTKPTADLPGPTHSDPPANSPVDLDGPVRAQKTVAEKKAHLRNLAVAGDDGGDDHVSTGIVVHLGQRDLSMQPRAETRAAKIKSRTENTADKRSEADTKGVVYPLVSVAKSAWAMCLKLRILKPHLPWATSCICPQKPSGREGEGKFALRKI